MEDALKQIEKMNSEIRAISALIHLNYNLIDGRNKDKIRSHLANAIRHADKYEKIKRNLSEMDKIMLLGDSVDVWNGERVGVPIWEMYFRNVTSKLYDDTNY